MPDQKEWKAIKVTIGKEDMVKATLEEEGIEVCAPIVVQKERARGEWKEVRRPLLAGYLLIHVKWDAELYYKLRDMWFVQYPLVGYVEEEEVAYLKQYEELSCDSVIDYTGTLIRYSGAIAKEPERICRVDKRKERALICFQLGEDGTTKRWVPVKIIR